MINSQSTITLDLPYGDGTAQPSRLPLCSKGMIYFQPKSPTAKRNTKKQISKNNKWAEVEYIIYRKKLNQ